MSELAEVVYAALDYNLPEDEECQMSQELEHLFDFMTADGKFGRERESKAKINDIVCIRYDIIQL